MTNQLFNRAIAAKTCEFLQVSGQGAMAYAAWSLLTPGPFDDFALLAYGGVAQFAYAAGCEWDPNQPPPTDGNTFGCVKKEPGTSNALVRDKCGYSPGDPDYLVYCAVRMDQITEITGVREFKNANGPTVSRYEIDVIKSNGTYEAITTNGGNAAGGEAILLRWDGSEGWWTARMTGSAWELGTFLNTSAANAVEFKTENGTPYGPFIIQTL